VLGLIGHDGISHSKTPAAWPLIELVRRADAIVIARHLGAATKVPGNDGILAWQMQVDEVWKGKGDLARIAVLTPTRLPFCDRRHRVLLFLKEEQAAGPGTTFRPISGVDSVFPIQRKGDLRLVDEVVPPTLEKAASGASFLSLSGLRSLVRRAVNNSALESTFNKRMFVCACEVKVPHSRANSEIHILDCQPADCSAETVCSGLASAVGAVCHPGGAESYPSSELDLTICKKRQPSSIPCTSSE
jgi:hypothetical protein